METMVRNALAGLGRAIVIASLVALATAAPPLRASSPCDPLTPPAPHPPGGQPEPFIGGLVLLGQTTVVSGATVRLHRCDGGTDVVVDTVQTLSNGYFQFDDLVGPSWYYVAAELSGPLSGHSPVHAPTLIPIGPGESAIVLQHE